jgi:hypothetical protein
MDRYSTPTDERFATLTSDPINRGGPIDAPRGV